MDGTMRARRRSIAVHLRPVGGGSRLTGGVIRPRRMRRGALGSPNVLGSLGVRRRGLRPCCMPRPSAGSGLGRGGSTDLSRLCLASALRRFCFARTLGRLGLTGAVADLGLG